MNINANEILSLKKIKFGEKQEGNSSASNPATTDNDVPEAGLNALRAQGLNNVMANPVLASKLGVNEDAPQTKSDATGYVAPYQSNVAFQGGKFKNLAMASMMALMTLGAATMTSCEDTIITETSTSTESTIINIDFAAIQNMANEIKLLREEMAKRDEEMAKKYDQLLTMFNSLLTMIQQNQLTNEAFMTLFLTNQETIIELLIANGMKQEDANAKLDSIYEAVKSGQMTAQQALQEITKLLGDIKGLLQEAITEFKSYYEAMMDKQNEIIESNKEGFEQVINNGNITKELLEKIIAQNNGLLELNRKASAERTEIKNAIINAKLDNNANFEKVVETLNVNKQELIDVLVKMGYKQADIIKMTTADILAAIDKNSQITDKGNQLLVDISNKLTILPDLLKEGKITNAQLEAFYNEYKNAVNNGGGFDADMIAKMEALLGKLDKIQATLDKISEQLNTIITDYNAFKKEYAQDKIKEFELMNQLIQENKIQTSILESMKKSQANMEVNIAGINKNVALLLDIAKDDSRHKELIEAINNAGNSSNIDVDAMKAMFKEMGLELSQVIKMSASELKAAIEKFQKTYVDVEADQTEQLKAINAKLDDIKLFNEIAKDELLAAINKTTQAVENGDKNITAELDGIEAQLDKILAEIKNLLKEVATFATKAETYLSSYSAKWDATLGLLEGIDANTSKIIANQAVAQKTFDNILDEIKNLKDAIKNFQGSTGCEGITPEELEAMWQKHDDANFERYSKLLKGLGINSCDHKNMEDLLASIDSKLDYIKGNSDILNKILAKLDGIELTNEQLAEIKELLKNFKCNCECGSSNEGILGDLDNILG